MFAGTREDRVRLPELPGVHSVVTVNGWPESIRVDWDGTNATITVGNGDRHNILTTRDWRQLTATCQGLAAERDLRVVVIVGSGSAFSAGSDLREWAEADVAEVEKSFGAMEAAFAALEGIPVPTIAAVRGVAVGAGCELALAADIRVLSEDACMGLPILKLGILPPPSFVGRLVQAVGPGVARDLLYTGRLMSAEEAVRAGLANSQVPAAELEGTTRQIAETVASFSPGVVRAAKQAFLSMGRSGETAVSAMVHDAIDGELFRRAIGDFLAGRR